MSKIVSKQVEKHGKKAKYCVQIEACNFCYKIKVHI